VGAVTPQEEADEFDRRLAALPGSDRENLERALVAVEAEIFRRIVEREWVTAPWRLRCAPRSMERRSGRSADE